MTILAPIIGLLSIIACAYYVGYYCGVKDEQLRTRAAREEAAGWRKKADEWRMKYEAEEASVEVLEEIFNR